MNTVLRRLFLILISFLAASAVSARNDIKYYTVSVEETYPHDRTSYTQGLFFHKGRMYESTGQYGESTFREVDIRTGEALQRLNFDRRYFVEGSVVLNDKLYILTWNERVCFVYDINTLNYLGQFYYPREGWGLTTDGKSLIASDGSSMIHFLDPATFGTQRSITVRLNGRAMRFINELEYIDGKIWANVYLSDTILIIDPQTGNVEGVVDCSSVYPQSARDREDDVFNGIAYNPEDGKIYVTGKCWNKLYRISVKENKQQ